MIKATELLLNALNQGDFETYARLCDPHMTSFEPENLGHLIDNMEYRRLCLDQARQFQLHQLQSQQIQTHNQSLHQTASAAAAAAASAAVTNLVAKGGVGGAAGCGGSPTASQLQQIASLAATAAATAAMANLNLANNHNTTHHNSQQNLNSTTQQPVAAPAGSASSCSNSSSLVLASSQLPMVSVKHYALMLNPNVYLLGEDAASIAYTKLSQTVDLLSGRLQVEQSEETRIWHRKGDGRKWLCVHFHRSLASSGSSGLRDHLCSPTATTVSSGPQTNVSLMRAAAQQLHLANLTSIQAQIQQPVPSISLNHTGGGGAQQQQKQQQNSSG